MRELPSNEPTMWHLCWQAAIGREFVPQLSFYARIRGLLLDVLKRKGRTLIDFAVLPTEIHVVAEIPPGETAGGVARAIGNVVARWVRATAPLRSPVLAGPYRSSRIESAAAQREEARMLAWRPVFLGRCKTPAHYQHAGYRIAIGQTTADGFDVRPLLRVFGVSVPEARAALRAWVAQRPTAQELRTWELTRGLVLVTGSGDAQLPAARELRGGAAAALVAAGGDDIAGAIALLETWVAAKLNLRAAAELHTAANAAGARGRSLVACLADGYGLCSAATVARHFHRAKATLSEQMAARRASGADRPILATPAKRIIEEALALRDARAKLDALGRE
jgi:hypothetical protein